MCNSCLCSCVSFSFILQICSLSRFFRPLPLGNKYSICVLSLRIASLFLFMDKMFKHQSSMNGFFYNCILFCFRAFSRPMCLVLPHLQNCWGRVLYWYSLRFPLIVNWKIYAIFCISQSDTEIRRNLECHKLNFLFDLLNWKYQIHFYNAQIFLLSIMSTRPLENAKWGLSLSTFSIVNRHTFLFSCVLVHIVRSLPLPHEKFLTRICHQRVCTLEEHHKVLLASLVKVELCTNF